MPSAVAAAAAVAAQLPDGDNGFPLLLLLLVLQAGEETVAADRLAALLGLQRVGLVTFSPLQQQQQQRSSTLKTLKFFTPRDSTKRPQARKRQISPVLCLPVSLSVS